MAKVMRLGGPAWSRLSRWGHKGKRLKEWQCGIADTLAGYANGGWVKRPSPKQVAQALRILEAAAEFGFDPMPDEP